MVRVELIRVVVQRGLALLGEPLRLVGGNAPRPVVGGMVRIELVSAVVPRALRGRVQKMCSCSVSHLRPSSPPQVSEATRSIWCARKHADGVRASYRVVSYEGTFPPARAVVLDPSQDAKEGNLVSYFYSCVVDDVNQGNATGSVHHRLHRLADHRRPTLGPKTLPRLVQGFDLGNP